jgi:hypothetical protein
MSKPRYRLDAVDESEIEKYELPIAGEFIMSAMQVGIAEDGEVYYWHNIKNKRESVHGISEHAANKGQPVKILFGKPPYRYLVFIDEGEAED